MSKLPLHQIIKGNALEVMVQFPPHSVDMIFADPPYNLQLNGKLWRPNHTQVNAVTDKWDQFASLPEYDDFTKQWLSAARNVMKPNGTIWVSGTYHNIFRVGCIMQDMGFWILNTITWHKTNAMPNFRGKRLKNDVEYVIWAKYNAKSAYTFNHHAMKQFNEGKQLGSVWAIPACGGRERLRGLDGQKLHSAQKPEKLLLRILLASTRPGDIVLDPFSGTGTTAAVAELLHRQWIGIEQGEDYVNASRARIEKVKPLPDNHPMLEGEPQDRNRISRVPFKQLLAEGLIHVGETLYFDSTGVTAVVLANGQITTGELTGSIHQVGAKLTGLPSSNGWMHWHFVDKRGKRQPLDVLRQQLRARDNSE
jgi:modification methylase